MWAEGNNRVSEPIGRVTCELEGREIRRRRKSGMYQSAGVRVRATDSPCPDHGTIPKLDNEDDNHGTEGYKLPVGEPCSGNNTIKLAVIQRKAAYNAREGGIKWLGACII